MAGSQNGSRTIGSLRGGSISQALPEVSCSRKLSIWIAFRAGAPLISSSSAESQSHNNGGGGSEAQTSMGIAWIVTKKG